MTVAEPVLRPRPLSALAGRYDRQVFDVGDRTARVRLDGPGVGEWDLLLRRGRAKLQPARDGARPDARLTADADTWREIADDFSAAMAAFRMGRLRIRHDLHLGVGFLAATAAGRGPHHLSFSQVHTRVGTISTMQAGTGPPVICIHGLGGTKASFLPTVAALARRHRVIAMDLPGFGDSDKPVTAPYDARFFAGAAVALLDALDIDRASFAGNSMGGRVALELGMAHRARVDRLVLLAPSLAWLRDRPWAPLLRLVPPQLGLVQPAPRAIVEGIVRRAVPNSGHGAVAAGLDEFLRAYLEPRGRAAFYAAARNIYLEEPHGPDGFWTRLRELSVPSLFVWGRQDPLVPIAFARHVRDALPEAEHVELDCGHVPQLERPRAVHDAVVRFLR